MCSRDIGTLNCAFVELMSRPAYLHVHRDPLLTRWLWRTGGQGTQFIDTVPYFTCFLGTDPCSSARRHIRVLVQRRPQAMLPSDAQLLCIVARILEVIRGAYGVVSGRGPIYYWLKAGGEAS